MKYSFLQEAVPANSEPDPTPENHHCMGSNCPKCRRRNRIVSRPDRPRTPNHYCIGNGCPKCNSPRHARSSSTSLPNYGFRSITTHDESSLFAGPSHFSVSEIMPVASNSASINNAFWARPSSPRQSDALQGLWTAILLSNMKLLVQIDSALSFFQTQSYTCTTPWIRLVEVSTRPKLLHWIL